MKVVCFNGSPRGGKSNTNVMIEALAAGLRSGVAELVQFQLSEKRIEYCAGCYSCWMKTPGRCVKDDDMKDLIDEMRDADLYVFGTPLYFNNVSGTLKAFFDRLTAAGGNPHAAAEKAKDARNLGIVMMANCGFPVRSQFDIVSSWIRNVSSMMKADLLGEFYTTGGKALTQPTAEQLGSRGKYLAYLEDCGKRLSAGLALTDEQKRLIGKNVSDF